MQNMYERVIRCLCSCLIKKQQQSYVQVNDQKHKFMSINEYLSDQQRSSQYNQKHSSDLSTDISNRFSKYMQNQLQANSPTQTKYQSLAKQQSSEQQQSSLLNVIKEDQKDYSDVISSTHPYYHLFKQKLDQLPTVFNLPSQACTAHPDTVFPLKLHCFQQGKTNVFKYFFTFPTDYETYQAISSDFQLQKKFDSNIQEFKKVLETPQRDAKLIYLAYKKVLILSSRDFEYVRYVFKKDGQFWTICVSDMSRQQVNGKVRGEMLMTVTKIVEHDGFIDVSVSSQVDMKMPVKLQMAKNRGFAQIRKYLDKVYNHIKSDDKSML